jgi:metal-responsive CopG/Arc/MetJ family transcriptional regulator
MHRTNIYLDDEQLAALDRLASARGTSRAEVVRDLIDRGLGGDGEDLASDLDAIDRSFGAIADEAVVFDRRRDDARARHLERVWNR